MIKNFRFYLNRGDGFSKAFRLSFGLTPRDLLLIVCLFLLWATFFATALEARAADNKLRVLEEIVIKCTDRGDHSILIDNEIWMCGATPTGIKVP